MQLLHVQPQFVDRAWRDGASALAKACDTSGGEVTGDQLKMILARGERTLIRMDKNFTLDEPRQNPDGSIQNYESRPVGWGVIRVDQLPNVRVLHICEVYAPHNLHAEYFEQIKELAKSYGCSEVRCSAKPAQARLYRMKFQFESVYETLRVSLC